MRKAVEFLLNKASEVQIAGHLSCCDEAFVPNLSVRININDYASKISKKAVRFEAWSGRELIGLVAMYCNAQEHQNAYITSVSVQKEWMGNGIATFLVKQCIGYAKASGMTMISLEVASENNAAMSLYKKNGFIAVRTKGVFVVMNLVLNNEAGNK